VLPAFGISAWYLLKGVHLKFAKASITVAIVFAALTTVLQSLSADATARGVVRNQPIKLAAMEGVYTTQNYTPMTAFGVCRYEDPDGSRAEDPGPAEFPLLP